MNRLSPQMAGIRLLFCVVLALIAGFIFGVRWAASMDTSDHRRYLPPVPAFMAFEIPDPTLPASCCVADVVDYAVPVREPTQRSASPSPRPSRKPTERVRETGRTPHIRAHHNISGYAVWHATGRDGRYGAAGPELRKAIGKGWRGSQILVCNGKPSRCLIVTLSDWCLCSRGHRLVDLSDEAYSYFRPLSTGIMRVSVGW